MLDEVNIKRIAGLAEFDFLPVGPVEVGLNLYVGAFPSCVLPAREQIASGHACLGVLLRLRRRRKRGNKGSISALPPINIALHREGVLLAAFPIRTEANLVHPPSVEAIPVRVKFRPANRTHAVDAIAENLPRRAAIADGPRSLVH